MKTLVFGARGTLGQALMERLPQGDASPRAVTRVDCDLRDPRAVERFVLAAKPEVIYNAAAFTDVDGAEDRGDEAFTVNALAPEAMARACAQVNAKLVHYSTDFVFDGEQERAYDEFDAPSPQGVYARSKVAGERLTTQAWRRVFVVRVGCLYGVGGRNFPSTILRRLRAGERIRADSERRASPTWVGPVVTVSAALAATDDFGTYHCTAHGETTWVDFARFVAQSIGAQGAVVESLPTHALPMKAPRPRRAILDKRLLRLRGLDTLGTWQDQCTSYLATAAGTT